MNITKLYHDNPAGEWLRRKYTISMDLVNGSIIAVQFDMPSVGKEGFHFSPEKVDKLFGQFIKYGRKEEMHLDEYDSVCSSISDSLNNKMAIRALEILNHAQSSYSILACIVSGNESEARILLAQLGISLLAFEPVATSVGWGDWMVSCSDYLKGKK